MKTSNEKKNNAVILTIEGTGFILPEGKDLSEVLNALAGMRRIREDYFYNVKPERRIMVDLGEAEFSVKSSRREMVTDEQYAEIKKVDDEARAARSAKAGEEKI